MRGEPRPTSFSPCGRRWPSAARSDEGCHGWRQTSCFTPHPALPRHLLPQGEKDRWSPWESGSNGCYSNPNTHGIAALCCDRERHMKTWWELGDNSALIHDPIGITECAYCGHEGKFKQNFHIENQSKSGKKNLCFKVLSCENCGNVTMLMFAQSPRGYSGHRQLPYPLGRIRAPDFWPKDVSRYWTQAHSSAAAGNWDAAAVMTRSALQLALRASGADAKTLQREIGHLAAKQQLPATMVDWAHEVRQLGNESAHPEVGADGASERDTKEAIKFLDFLLEYLFTLPHEIHAFRERRRT